MSIWAQTLGKLGPKWSVVAHTGEVCVLLALIAIATMNRIAINQNKTIMAAQQMALIEYRATAPTRIELKDEFTKLMMEVARLNGSLDTLLKVNSRLVIPEKEHE